MAQNDCIYIYAPEWVEWSAGIRVLHYLCDLLNQNGINAFLAIHGLRRSEQVNSDLNTPILTPHLIESHLKTSRRIIALYPEGIVGNPLNAQYAIRWILNFPSLLGGKLNFQDDKVFTYSSKLQEAFRGLLLPSVLFVPAVRSADIENYLAMMGSINSKNRKYELIYAQKFRALGGKLSELKSNQIEINRFGKSATTRYETLSLVHNADLVHVYENSTITTEALLFGVSVVCHSSEYFNTLIAEHELPMVGVVWDNAQVLPANSSLNIDILKGAEKKANQNIVSSFTNVHLSQNRDYNQNKGIRLPKRGLITKHSVDRGLILLKQKGIKVFIRFFLNYANRNK